MVTEGRFREDLFYRLNVFPVTIPPLRDRAEDIPQLVRHFVDVFAHRMNRRIEVIPDYIVEALSRYPWPGNIRELENFVERSVVLTTGTSLEAPLHELVLLEQETTPAPVTLRDAERAHIRKILNQADGVIATAAHRLGLPRSTLFYKMRRLGISAGREQNGSCIQAVAAG
jgi:formate hydrogenlyase transcriptional activator